MSSEISSSQSEIKTVENSESVDDKEPAEEDVNAGAAATEKQSADYWQLAISGKSVATAASSSTEDDVSSASTPGGSNKSKQRVVESPAPSAIARTNENDGGNGSNDSESNPNSSVAATSFDLGKMLVQYSKELICILALALTTYATLQNSPPKVSRAPSPVPLFSPNSAVQEWPEGQLNVIQSQVSMSELSLVLFYAPWCAESQFAKHAYEKVAHKYQAEAYFAAVNCWQPGGECRLQYAKVQTWPVLMAYYPQGVAVQYSGPWLVQPLSRFIDSLMKPYKRVASRSELDRLRIDSNAVIVGFFSSNDLRRREFVTFVQSAIKWLERDPYQDVQFAVVTGESCRHFSVVQTPAIKLYNWNETLEAELPIKWSVENITKWLKDRLNFITTWIHPPGRKSTTLAPFVKAGPTVIFFTPKDYYTFNKDAYHMLKQVALEYYRHKNGSEQADILGASVYSLRQENRKRYLKLKKTCVNVSESDSEYRDSGVYRSCTASDDPNITFANILNSSKYDKLMDESERYCLAGSSSSPCQKFFTTDWRYKFRNRVKKNYETRKFKVSMLQPEFDSRSAFKLREQSEIGECRALRLSENSFGNVFFPNEKLVIEPEFVAKAAEFNRTLSFILLDSIMYKPIADRLGINLDSMPNKSSVIIIDNDNDSTYHLEKEISTKSVMNFLKNFISGMVRRKLRSTKKTRKSSWPAGFEIISLKEVTSKEFNEHIKNPRRTIVVLFYSAQCAMCSLMSQTLLVVSKILEAIDIDFLRIDSDINDLQWQYTMDTYPTLIFFPRNRISESRKFPHRMKVTVFNVLGFVLANLSPDERLQALFESCHFRRTSIYIQNCLYALRGEISNHISRNLRQWRHEQKRRNGILRKLQILQRIYLISFEIDTYNGLESIRKDVMQFRQLSEKG